MHPAYNRSDTIHLQTLKMLTLFNTKRKRACTPLEDAIVRDDTHVLSKLLASAVRIPDHCLELAASHGNIATFDMLVKFVPALDFTQLLESQTLAAVAIKNGHFNMFIHLIKHHKSYFAIDALYQAINNNVPEAAVFILETLFQPTTSGWFQPMFFIHDEINRVEHDPCIKVTSIGEEGVKFTQEYIDEYFTHPTCMESHVFQHTTLHSSSVEHLEQLRLNVLERLPYVLQTINLDTFRTILDHPLCPSNLPQRCLLMAIELESQYIYNMLEYLHTKFDLTKLVQHEYVYPQPQAIFDMAIEHEKFSACDFMLAAGIQPTHTCWSKALYNLSVPALHYLDSKQLPFVPADVQWNNYAFIRSAIYYVLTSNRAVLDFMLSKKCILQPETDHIIGDILNCCELTKDGTIIARKGTSHEFSESVKTKDSIETVNKRIIEMIDLFISLGCSFKPSDGFFNLSQASAAYPGVLSVYDHYRIDLYKMVDFTSGNNFYNRALYMLSRFNYRLPTATFERMLACLEDHSSLHSLLKYWFNDLVFRQFMMELFCPTYDACMPCCSRFECKHYTNTPGHSHKYSQAYPRLYQAFETVCQEAIDVVKEIHSVNSQIGLHEDVIDSVVAAYL